MTAQQKAIETYGIDSQLAKLAEECAELAAEALHVRSRGKEAIPALLSECADVEIMLEQMRHHYGDTRIDSERSRKLTRLERRLGIWSNTTIDINNPGDQRKGGRKPRPVYVDSELFPSLSQAVNVYGRSLAIAIRKGRDFKGHVVRYADA